jgi:hypothetical protein
MGGIDELKLIIIKPYSRRETTSKGGLSNSEYIVIAENPGTNGGKTQKYVMNQLISTKVATPSDYVF